jgi:hypothetical protein
MRYLLLLLFSFPVAAFAQIKWQNVDEQFQPLPKTMHVFYTTDSIDGKPNIGWYVSASLKDKSLQFVADTAQNRRLTPTQFYEKNNHPLVVVNCTFFEFVHHRNLNLVMNDGKVLAYNQATLPGKGKDTFTYRHTYPAAFGISKKRTADIAWTYADTSKRRVFAIQSPMPPVKDSMMKFSFKRAAYFSTIAAQQDTQSTLHKWKMKTAIGGGPVLIQNGKIQVSNDQELKFAGKARDDKHPRTAIGYTADGHVIIMVVQGRFAGKAEGASLTQLATMLQQLGCVEAMNLDGGGSSCMLINGKQTIDPSDKQQRAIPAVFMIK